jgi:hypothetical protein
MGFLIRAFGWRFTLFLSSKRRRKMGQRRRFLATATWALCSSTSATTRTFAKILRRCPMPLRRLRLSDRLMSASVSAAPVLGLCPCVGKSWAFRRDESKAHIRVDLCSIAVEKRSAERSASVVVAESKNLCGQRHHRRKILDATCWI